MASISTLEKRRLTSSSRSYIQHQTKAVQVVERQHRDYLDDDDDEEKKSDSSGAVNLPNDDTTSHHHDYVNDVIRQPQHLMKPPPKLERTTDTSPTTDDNQLKYYRVVYRGVVALLSQPDQGSSRSGCYLGYGEVVASRCQIPVIENNGEQHRESLDDQKDDSSTSSSSSSHPHRISAIRVDQVLTGGYAFDPPSQNALTTPYEESSETPKKSNIQGYSTTAAVGPVVAESSSSPATPAVNVAISQSSSTSSGDESVIDLSKLESSTSETLRCEHDGVSHYGFLFSHNNNNRQQRNDVPTPTTCIVKQLSHPPKCQHGQFFYKIISTTPLPIISGPSTDAPLTKAMVLPGTIHEVSFRIHMATDDSNKGRDDDQDGIWFLRLGRRKGYIASRRIRRQQKRNQTTRGELLVQDVTDEINASGSTLTQIESATNSAAASLDDAMSAATITTSANISVLSVLSTSIQSSTTARNPNRRHRPPRRRRDNANDDTHRHVTLNNRMHHHNANNSNNTSIVNNSHHHNDTSTLTNLSAQSHSSDRLQTPSSNVSLLSDDSSLLENHHYNQQHQQQHTSFSSQDNNSHNPRFHGALSPDRSIARSVMSNQSSQQQQHQHSTFFLMRVTAPRGLRILDAPHFQVNNLIHGTQQSGGVASTTLAPNPATDVAALSGLNSNKNQHHLFHTMAGRITATNGITPMDNAFIFDSVTKTRILPRGAVYEASKRMESSDALFHQGAGLIKLADNSGWAIVPHRKDLELQYHTFNGGASSVKEGEALRGGYEEIGNAVVSNNAQSENLDQSFPTGVWMRVVARQGTNVVCAPPAPPLHHDGNIQSPSSSPTSSAVSGATNQEQLAVGKSDSTSDVASSVGSSFLDAMFRGQKRNEASDHTENKQGSSGASAAHVEKAPFASTTIPCGICVHVEPHIPPEHPQRFSAPQEFARLKGGQGWLPLFISGKPSCIVCPRRNSPDSRLGSFWFRVQAKHGIKVRLGPSKRAPSIKSGDGVYFRFECGEFLRASEVMTVYREDNHGRTISESFAKLYRNRHVRLASSGGNGPSDVRHLASLTSQAEWVQVHDDGQNEQYLQECKTGPRIERHRQGWRYKIATSSGISIKKGPSFEAEDSGLFVEEGESVVVIERVTSPDEHGVTWLRMKEGKGWLHNVGRENGETLVIPHTLRNRTQATNSRPTKPRRPSSDDKNQQIAYNTIIARLFHNDLPGDHQHRGAGGQPGTSTIGR